MSESVISRCPSVDRFVGVSRDQVVSPAGTKREFRVLLYGAYNAMGLIGSEFNGVAVLQQDPPAVVADGLAQEASGYHGPSAAQIAYYERLIAMRWDEFREEVNSARRLRFEL